MTTARLALLAALMLAAPAATHAPPRAEQRCGWLVNETPGNFELTDRDRTWTIAQQGGYEAEGFERMPDMSARDWRETNGAHGYGCACLRVVTDRANDRIARLFSARPLALAACTRDGHLPRM